ncbi:DUF4115 domain-containing protein [Simiduia sp. 21SJ11W-1]|uniref:helix-turn-helix domain-containing protein n=1 Tax=Simiduia sp. 21SJ11W-1 TaxID=2909669 RepID=UPI0020A017B3|nr:RodZ domain-containing protein [Simiduia sp. 21SJ11W-1]UTA49180.1 DUF4115 domain-containing protein [Simiduia sp. 21SJ11W-1]
MTSETESELTRAECTELSTPGAFLQREREAQKLDEKSVAAKLRITRSKLAALESDSYDQFPGETFIKGYLRAYARLLQLDEAQVLQRYTDYVAAHSEVSQLVAPSRPQGVVSALAGESMKASGGVPKWAAGAVVVAIAFAVAYYFLAPGAPSGQVAKPAVITETDSSSGNAPAHETVEVAADAPAADAFEGDADIPAEGANSGTETNDDASAANAAEQASQAPAVTENSDSDAAPAAAVANHLDARAPDQLALEFTGECWVEISDANGDVLATELQAAGSSLLLKGKAPFNVMLGNARAVTVAINGRPVDASPKGNNRALRFVVSAAL